MNRLRLVGLALAAACVGTAKPISDDALEVACRGTSKDLVLPDKGACRQLGLRALERGDGEGALEFLGRSCPTISASCADLAAIHMDGKLVPQDFEAGFKIARLGCGALKADGDACGWAVLDTLSRDTATATRRNLYERTLERSCLPKNAGWACYNYGVALACGYLGEPDPEYAKGVLHRACTKGDPRGCELIDTLAASSTPPSCDLMGPDPKHPVDLGITFTPLDPAAVLPPGDKRFRRVGIP